MVLSYTTRYGGITNVCTSTALSVITAEREERRDDDQRVHESGTSVNAFIFISEPCSDSSLLCSVALPSNGLVTFHYCKLFHVLSPLFSDPLAQFCSSLSLIRIQDGCAVCASVCLCQWDLMSRQRLEKQRGE